MKTYLRGRCCTGAPWLSEAFVKRISIFTRGRCWRAGAATRAAVRAERGWELGEAGEVYVKRAFPAENKERVLQLVKDIEAAGEGYRAAEWMAPETKKQAQLKLNGVLNRLAIQTVGGLLFGSVGRTSFLQNRQHAPRLSLNAGGQIGQPAGPHGMDDDAANDQCYEDPQNNTINYSGGLSPRFFRDEPGCGVNYGRSGVIGTNVHGLTRGRGNRSQEICAIGGPRMTRRSTRRGEMHFREYTQPIRSSRA